MISSRLPALIRFSLVGIIGFLVDAGIVFILTNYLNSDPVFSRIPAWLLAVTTTYIFNVNFTFLDKSFLFGRNSKTLKKYILYIFSQLLGGCVNILVFGMLIAVWNLDWLPSLVIGTLCGLTINFSAARMIIKK